MPEPSILFAVCGCRYKVVAKRTEGSRGGMLERDQPCPIHLRPRNRDIPVGEGIPANICGTCGQTYDEDYCPACEELE